MADVLTAAQRRRLMQSVRQKDTRPELAVRRLLHGLGYRYRLHRRDLPGSPDLVFPARRKVIFVHGCFWHAHDCRYGRPPKSRREFWLPKLEQNKMRDAKKIEQLEVLGWDVLVVWGCEIGEIEKLKIKLQTFLDGDECK